MQQNAKQSSNWFDRVMVLSLISFLAVFSGCSHKSESQAASDSGNSGAQTRPTASTTPAAEQPTAGNTPAMTVSSADAQGALAETQAALRSKEYEKAAQAMIAMQQAKLSEQQAQAVRSQMILLQRDLANAVSQGDPKAKAAADLLRRSASGGH